jgi:hypothetical protein
MNNTVVRNVKPDRTYKLTDVSEKLIVSIFRVEQQEQQGNEQAANAVSAHHCLLRSRLLYLPLGANDGEGIGFFQKVSKLPGYTVLYSGRYNS